MKIIPDQSLSTLQAVTSEKILNYSKFHEEGLFSEQIFGPIESYRCWCQVPTTENICSKCGIEITSSSVRRTRYAVIEVDRIINPALYLVLSQSQKASKAISNLISMKKCLVKEGEKMYFVELDQMSGYRPILNLEGKEVYYGLDAVRELILKISNVPGNPISDFISNNSDHIFSKYIVVIPPSLRPCHMNGKKLLDSGMLNRIYESILKVKNTFEGFDPFLKIRQECEIEKLSEKLVEFVIDRISHKEGLIRNNLLGKRIDFSGRSVIVVDPSIPIDTIRLPKLMCLEMFRLEISRELFKKGKFLTFKKASNYVTELYSKGVITQEIDEILQKVVKDQIVIYNRQPTLHRGSMYCGKIVLGDSKAIGLNPLVCNSLNADFDGDTIAIYRVLTPAAKREASSKMLPTNNLYSPANAVIQVEPKQGIIYGLYRMSQTEEGRKEISRKLGINVDCILDKKNIIRLLQIHSNSDPSLPDKVKELGFDYLRRFPETLSFFDIYSTDYETLSGDIEKDKDIISRNMEKVKNIFPKRDIVESGARASWDQVIQVVAHRGYVSDFYGSVLPYCIKNSYCRGLKPEEYFVSAYGCRKSLLDVAENTAKSGYLTRKLIYALSDVVLSEQEDCGTSDCLLIYVSDMMLARSLVGRFYYESDPYENTSVQMKCVTNPEDIFEKKIYLRSPIVCSSKDGICKTCYGKLSDITYKYIGVIAAQSIGERSTQMVLRTFHTGGVAQSSNLKRQEDIVGTIREGHDFDKTIKLDSLSDIVNWVLRTYDSFKKYGYLHLVHFEVLASRRLYARLPSKKLLHWRTNLDLLEEYEEWDEDNRLLKTNYEYVLMSLKSIPFLDRPFLGFAFENARKGIVSCLINNKKIESILERIVLGDL